MASQAAKKQLISANHFDRSRFAISGKVWERWIMTTVSRRISKNFLMMLAGALVVLCSLFGMLVAQAPQKTTFLVIYRPGPGWLPGKPTAEQPLKEHGRYMLSLYEKGFLKFAGPFGDDKGGALALEVANDAEAQALVAEDPAVKSGVFLHEIHPWQLVSWEKFLKKK